MIEFPSKLIFFLTVATVPPMILVAGLTPHLQESRVEFSNGLGAVGGSGLVVLVMI